MPNYKEPVSGDTPCLGLPVTKKEKQWLMMHIGCELHLAIMDGGVLVEDLTCNAYLIETTDTTKLIADHLERRHE